MLAIYGLFATLWAASLILTTWGTLYSCWRLRLMPPPRKWKPGSPPVSILKPIKGVDPGLLENLLSFAALDYHDYEVIMVIADQDDPAVAVAQMVMSMYPKGPYRLIAGETPVGLVGQNPKVLNLIVAEAAARFDILLVSDSNIRAQPSYLQETTPPMRNELNGIITAPIEGFGGEGWGGELEELHLNTFCVRWVNTAKFFNQAFVMGKSMMYSKATAQKFGGITACAGFINEDYVMGQMMKFIGKRVDIMQRPIRQYVGAISFRQFCQRHYRWTVIQKKSVTWIFAAHPLQFASVMVTLGAVAAPEVWNVFSPLGAGVLTLALWFGLDTAMIRALGGRAPSVGLWLVREAVLPVIWFKALIDDRVDWRGHKIKVLRDGAI